MLEDLAAGHRTRSGGTCEWSHQAQPRQSATPRSLPEIEAYPEDRGYPCGQSPKFSMITLQTALAFCWHCASAASRARAISRVLALCSACFRDLGPEPLACRGIDSFD